MLLRQKKSDQSMGLQRLCPSNRHIASARKPVAMKTNPGIRAPVKANNTPNARHNSHRASTGPPQQRRENKLEKPIGRTLHRFKTDREFQ